MEVQLHSPCVPGCETSEEKIGVKTLLALRLAPYLSQSTDEPTAVAGQNIEREVLTPSVKALHALWLQVTVYFLNNLSEDVCILDSASFCT